MPRLIDLQPQFLRFEMRDDEWRRIRQGVTQEQWGDAGEEQREALVETVRGPRAFWVHVDSIAEAQGVMFLCPKCFVANGGNVSTNSIESFWAVMKRGLTGVYHHTSRKHLGRYVNEFAFRLNAGNVKRHTLERLNSFVDAAAGKRLTYAQLIA